MIEVVTDGTRRREKLAAIHARSVAADAELTAAVTPGDYHVIVITTLGAGPEPGMPVLRGKLSY